MTDYSELNDEDFCKHGIYPKTSCTICFKKDDLFPVEIAYEFAAKSDYYCFDCKNPILRGDLVFRLTDDRIVDFACKDKYKEKLK